MRDEYEYERFLWKAEGIQGFYIQETGKGCDSNINYTKLRKDNTVLTSWAEYATLGHHDIWIDIFALDKIPRDEALRKKYFFLQSCVSFIPEIIRSQSRGSCWKYCLD